MEGPRSRSERGRGLLTRLFETDLDRKDRSTKVFQFVFPWVIFLASAFTIISILTVWKGWDTARNLLDIWIFYTIPPAGKETLIPKVVLDKYHPVPGLMAGLSTTIIDICFSLFMIWNYDWVKRMPVMGPALERTEAKGREKVAGSRWFGRATFAMTTFFVFVPLSGSGGVGGTIFGRVVGMRPYRVLLAVIIGSTIGSLGYAMAAEQLSGILGSDNIFITFMSNLNMLQVIAIILVLGFVVYTIRYPRMAVMRTARVISQALDISEKALLKAEEHRKRAAGIIMDGTKDTLKGVGQFNRAFADINIHVATMPIELMGSQGRKVAHNARMKGREGVEAIHRTAGTAVSKTIEMGQMAASESLRIATDLTIEGVKQTKTGVRMAGSVLEKGGERVERSIYKRGGKGRNGDGPKDEDQIGAFNKE